MIEAYVEDICCMLDLPYIEENKIMTYESRKVNIDLLAYKSLKMIDTKQEQLTMFDIAFDDIAI